MMHKILRKLQIATRMILIKLAYTRSTCKINCISTYLATKVGVQYF